MAEATYIVRSALQAAKDLKNYLGQKGVALGSKASPVPFIAAAQADMGTLVADGIFGPKTRTRMNDILSGKVVVPNIVAAASVAPPQPALAVLPQPVVTTMVEPQPEPEPEPEQVFALSPPPEPIQPEAPAYVQEAIAAIPQPVRTAVANELVSFAQQPSGSMADYETLLASLSERFTPVIKSIADEVNLQAAQRQATSEHQELMREDERWGKNNDLLQRIVNKFADLQKVLTANNAVNKKVYEAYGIHL